MRQGSITIGLIIIIVTLVIYLVKNKDVLMQAIDKLKSNNSKKVKVVKFLILLFLLVILIFFVTKNIKVILKNINIYQKNLSYNKVYEYSGEKKKEENEFYNSVINENYNEQKYDNPYIPEGFSYVEGNYNNGFIIQDENENQYVWIPCTNKEIKDATKLQKRNFVGVAFISKDSCYDEEYQEFLKSALTYGGFYVSRFEIGKENNLPVSKKGVEVWKEVTKKQAIDVIERIYPESNINCKLMNGFAYDTTLAWINSTNEVEANIIDLEKNKVIYSGRNEYNNIFDFADNVLELTTEISYDTVIVRGFSASEQESDFRIKFRNESRYSIFEENSTVSLEDALAFRTILYK